MATAMEPYGNGHGNGHPDSVSSENWHEAPDNDAHHQHSRPTVTITIPTYKYNSQAIAASEAGEASQLSQLSQLSQPSQKRCYWTDGGTTAAQVGR